MLSDNTRRVGNSGFRNYGTGLAITRMCGACAKPRPTPGGGLRRVLGLRTWCCADCKAKGAAK